MFPIIPSKYVQCLEKAFSLGYYSFWSSREISTTGMLDIYSEERNIPNTSSPPVIPHQSIKLRNARVPLGDLMEEQIHLRLEISGCEMDRTLKNLRSASLASPSIRTIVVNIKIALVQP